MARQSSEPAYFLGEAIPYFLAHVGQPHIQGTSPASPN